MAIASSLSRRAFGLGCYARRLCSHIRLAATHNAPDAPARDRMVKSAPAALPAGSAARPPVYLAFEVWRQGLATRPRLQTARLRRTGGPGERGARSTFGPGKVDGPAHL